jgi:hypothetical protein
MKFFANWQPLNNEDAHTALVFGFLRHAPPGEALDPWLSDVLDQEVRVEELQRTDFWPRYPAEDQNVTEPDLAFPVRAENEDNTWVIIEAKPHYHQHIATQLIREAVDTARHTGATRVALIMVGADLGGPAERPVWEEQINEVLGESIGGVSAQLAYSSWARLGLHIWRCGEAAPLFGRYAEDVLEHLRIKALLGYNGAPVFEGLETMSVPNVVQGFNRVVRSARQFFLALHSDSRFQAAGFRPIGNRGFEMLSDATSSVVTQYEDWFMTSTLVSPYSNTIWKSGQGAFAGFYFDDEEAYLVGGAFCTPAQGPFAFAFGESEDLAIADLSDAGLRGSVAPELDQASRGRQYEFRYGTRIWGTGKPEEDLEWTLGCLTAAGAIWTWNPPTGS